MQLKICCFPSIFFKICTSKRISFPTYFNKKRNIQNLSSKSAFRKVQLISKSSTYYFVATKTTQNFKDLYENTSEKYFLFTLYIVSLYEDSFMFTMLLNTQYRYFIFYYNHGLAYRSDSLCPSSIQYNHNYT